MGYLSFKFQIRFLLCALIGLTGCKKMAAYQGATSNSSTSSSETGGVVNPPVNPPPTGTLEGAKLYAQHCQLCHNPLATSLKLDRSSTQIQGAIGAIPAMSGLNTLSANEVAAIAQALKTTSAGPNPFFCQATAQPPAQRLQRLAKSEYTNTIRDLFVGAVALNELTAELAQFPEELNQDNPFDRAADSLNLGLVKGQAAIAERVAALVTGSAAKFNIIFIEPCFQSATVNDACLNSFLDRFGQRVYRRPVKAVERAPLIAAYRIGETGMESAGYLLRALLMSPNFLYHIENDGVPVDAAVSALNLSAFELASRLSYMTINSMPDTALMAAATNGTLLTASVYEAQMNRLLALSSSRSSFRRFFNLWFELNRTHAPAYSAYFKENINTDNLNAEALEESLAFIDHVVFENKKLGALLTDNTAFIKSTEVAKIYGVAVPANADGRTTLNAAQRAGVLTRVARTLSGNDGTSPILRGVAVRRSLLCDPLTAPDPNSLPAGSLNPPPDDPLLTTRKRFENKTSPAQCMTCHGQINPIGYALENYDALGRFRSMERVFNSGGTVVAQHPIDARATINLSAPPDPMVDGGIELSREVAGSQKFQACFAKKWFQFSMRKNPTALDNCVLAKTYDALNSSTGTLLDAIKSSLTNSEFKLRRMK